MWQEKQPKYNTIPFCSLLLCKILLSPKYILNTFIILKYSFIVFIVILVWYEYYNLYRKAINIYWLLFIGSTF